MHLRATAAETCCQLLRPIDLAIGDPDLRAPVHQLWSVSAAPIPDAPPVTKATFPDTLDGIAKG